MVKLIEDYYLNADKYQYIVGELKDRRRGNRTTAELMEPHYFATLAAAVNHVADEIVRRKIKNNELETLAAVVNEYHSICDQVTDMLDAAPRELRKKVNALDH